MNFDALANPALVAQLQLGNRVVVESFRAIQTGTYNPLFVRNFQMTANPGELNNLTNVLSDRVVQAGATVSPHLIAGVAGSLIAPSAHVGQMLSIPNGWDSARFRFVMRVRVDLASGLNSRYEVTGFSDHFGVSHGGALDTGMRFYINNITTIRDIVNANGTTGFISQGASQVLNGSIVNTPTGTGVFAMRPKDVVGEIQMQYMANNAGSNFKDGRANITGRSTSSIRNNAVPTMFLSNTLQNWLQTTRDSDVANDQAIVNNTLGRLQEDGLEENRFANALVSVQGMGNSGWFTLGTLQRLDPTFVVGTMPESRFSVKRLGGMTNFETVQMGMGSSWNGGDIEAIWASSMSQSVPAVMSKYFIGKLAFTSTNEIVGGQITTVITNLKSPNIAMMSEAISNAVTIELESLILKDLSYSGEINFTIKGEFDIYGDTRIELKIANRPVQTYFMPTFADGLGAPVITHDKNNLVSMAFGMESLMRKVTENVFGNSAIGDMPTINLDSI